MVIACAMFLWSVSLALLVTAFRDVFVGQSWGRRAVLLAPLLLGSALLFRPHENVFGGDDAGAYLNSGQTYVRRGRLFYVDDLLKHVPEEQRGLFLYRGHGHDIETKFHTLRIRDMSRALQGPWFQPAYSLLTGAAGLIAPECALYISPFFCLLCVLGVAGVAVRIWKRVDAAFYAALVMLLNPIVAWHGRCPRAEWPAAFHLLCGVLLLTKALERRESPATGALVLAGVAFALAPFYHASSWWGSIAAATVCGILVLRGHQRFILPPLLVAAGGLVFAWEMSGIVDWYGLRRLSAAVWDHAAALVVLVIACAVAGTWRGRVVRRGLRHSDARPPAFRLPGGKTGTLLLTILAALPVVLYVYPSPRSSVHPFSLLVTTDLWGFGILMSRMACAAGVVGLATLLHLARRNTAAFIALAALYPGMLLGQRISDYMYGARYFLVFLIPLFAIAIASLFANPLWNSNGWLERIRIPALCGLLLWSSWGKHHLYATTEYRGLLRYLEKLADQIREQRGILLFEYPRIAAPFEHFFDVPTLGIDSERGADSGAIDTAWAGVMEATPSRPAFFASAFDTVPMSEIFAFESVGKSSYQGHRLLQCRHAVPDAVRDWGLTMTLYRMHRRGIAGASAVRELPCRLHLGGRALAVRKFDRAMTRDWEIFGQSLPVGISFRLEIPAPARDAGEALVLAFTRKGGGLVFHSDKGPVPMADTVLMGEWMLRSARVPSRSLDHLRIEARDENVFLKDLYAYDADRVMTARVVDPGSRLVTTSVKSRFAASWMREGASVLCPVTGGSMITAFVHIPGEFRPPLALRIDPSESVVSPTLAVKAGEWRWCTWPLRPRDTEVPFLWVSMGTGQTVDRETPGYADDLALLGAYLLVLPLPGATP